MYVKTYNFILNYVKLKTTQHKTTIPIDARTLIKHITNRSRDVKSRWGHILNISMKDSNFSNVSCAVIRSFY